MATKRGEVQPAADPAALAAHYHARLTPAVRAYLSQVGITDETVEVFEIGADEPGARIGFGTEEQACEDFAGRLTFPVKDLEDRTVDLLGFSPQLKPRYRSLSGNLGLLFNRGIVGPSDPVFLCESVLDAVILTQSGFPAAAVPGGANFRPDMVQDFAGKEVFLVFSPNYSGRRNVLAVAGLLAPVARAVYVLVLPEGVPGAAELFAVAEEPQVVFAGLVESARRERRFEEFAPDTRSSAAFVREVLERQEGQYQGAPTGFGGLDKLLLGGLREGLYLLASTVGMGKTTLLRQLADQIVASSGTPVVFLTLEMSGFELWAKSIARLMEVPVVDVLTGRVPPDRLKEVASGYAAVAERMWTLEGNEATTIEGLAERVAEVRNRSGSVPVVIVDSLQRLPQALGDSSRLAETKALETALALKRLARHFSCPLLAAVSLSHKAGPLVGALVGAGGPSELADLEHVADVVALLRVAGSRAGSDAARAEMAQDPSRMVLEITKNRNGTSGALPMLFHKRVGRFAEGDHATNI